MFYTACILSEYEIFCLQYVTVSNYCIDTKRILYKFNAIYGIYRNCSRMNIVTQSKIFITSLLC